MSESAPATACIYPIDGVVTKIEDSRLPGRSHFQGVPASYGLRRGEIICADTPKEVTHRTADTPKEVTHRTADTPKEVTRSPGEVSSIRKRSCSTTAFLNAYIER
ncbi:hypothetical protein Tco_0817852 [Tanacetum coccineum]